MHGLRLRSGRLPEGIDIVLVGREPHGSENLSLRYLAGAVLSAGHRPAIVALDGPGSLSAAADRALQHDAPLIGLSLSDADITIDALAFARYLRGRGYRGHITCGGPLATLVRMELLKRHAELDSVIRHDGELPLIELARRLSRGEPWADVPAITTRDGDGPPAPLASPIPLQVRPLHADPLPKLLGVSTAYLSTSRGCPGRCPYCGPAALQREAVREARDAGLTRLERSQAGIGKTRHRHAVDVASEAAALYHDQGARFFQVVDENMLSGPGSHPEQFLETLIDELGRLGVGKTAWCLQADPATLTPAILDRLERLGVIRISVGIEGLTDSQRRSLGRSGEASAHQALLRRLVARGFVTNFNSIIVHPHTTVAAIESELGALENLEGVHFDVLSMAVYPGTRAHQILQREGRVTGEILALRFEPGDVAVNRFRATLIRMRLEALGRYALNTFANDVAINVALARRLGLPGHTPALERRVGAALRSLNVARLRAYRAALTLARTRLSDDARQRALLALMQRLRSDVAPVRDQLEGVQLELEGRDSGPIQPTNLMLASSLATGFILSLATACGARVDGAGTDAGARAQDAVAEATSPPSSGSGGGGSGGAPGGGTTSGSSGAPPGVGGTVQGGMSGGTSGTGGAPATGGVGASGCTPEEYSLQDQTARSVGQGACGHGNCPGVGISIDESGRVQDVFPQDGSPIPEDVRACYLDALGSYRFPCLSGEDIWYECVVTLR